MPHVPGAANAPYCVPDDTPQYEVVLLPGGQLFAYRCLECGQEGLQNVSPDPRGIFRPGMGKRNVRRLWPRPGDRPKEGH